MSWGTVAPSPGGGQILRCRICRERMEAGRGRAWAALREHLLSEHGEQVRAVAGSSEPGPGFEVALGEVEPHPAVRSFWNPHWTDREAGRDG